MDALSQLYLVREHFKAGGVLYLAGSVLTTAQAEKIPLLKVRLNERKLIRLDVSQSEIVNYCEWIKARYGTDAKANIREAITTLSAADDSKDPEEPEVPKTPPVPKAPVTSAKTEGASTPPPGTPPTPTGDTK